MLKKGILTALTLAFVLGLTLQAETAWETAISTDVKGKGGWFTCLNYSKDLHTRMVEKGHEAHFIIYEWKDANRTIGRHAFVVYKDEQGRYYGMDNRLKQPMWLTGENPEQWVNFFSKETANKVVCHYEDTALVGFVSR
jgi:hypothetical protein